MSQSTRKTTNPTRRKTVTKKTKKPSLAALKKRVRATKRKEDVSERQGKPM